MSKKQLARMYSRITDSQMLGEAETMRDLFEDDQPQFLAIDDSFDDNFKHDWDEKIETARKFPTDDAVSSENTVIGDELKQAWTACKIHFQDAKHYIIKAFPDKATQKTFGFADYRAMSRNPDRVRSFMDQFHAAADMNKTALIAQGYTQAKIDEIETLGGNFRSATRNKKGTKTDRFTETQNRVLKMNDVWQKLKKVNRASKNIFRNNAAKRKQYLLPVTSRKRPTPAPSVE